MRRGFALIEAVAGGVMLAAGLAVLIAIGANAMARQRLGEERLVAASLIDETLGAILMEGANLYPTRHDMSGPFDPPFQRYSREITIDAQGLAEPYEVAVTVRWRSGGVWREERVETLISHRPAEGPETREPGETILR